MKLYWSSRSPFVRKVMVAAHELGLAERIVTERVVVAANKPNAAVMAVNPLNKIPTLVLDDGSALYDSRVICEYLDTPARWTQAVSGRRGRALGCIAPPGARRRPDGGDRAAAGRTGATRRKCRAKAIWPPIGLKIATALDRIEAEGLAGAGRPHIGHIAIGCALAHLDFRFAADGWRTGRPGLQPGTMISRAARRCGPPSTPTFIEANGYTGDQPA